MRNIVKTSIVIAILFGASLLFAGSSVFDIINENWESYEVGANPHKPWKSTTGNKDFAVIMENDGNKYLQLQGQDFSGSAGIYREFSRSVVSGTIVAEMKLTADRQTQVEFSMRDAENSTQIFFFIDEHSISSRNCDVLPICGQFNDDEPFWITVFVDLDRDRYSIAVNGEENEECIGFPSYGCLEPEIWSDDGLQLTCPPINPINRIHLGRMKSLHNKIAIDDVHIYCQDCKFSDDDDDDRDGCGC